MKNTDAEGDVPPASQGDGEAGLRPAGADAEPGSIRGDLATAMPNNLVHGSDSPESAQREIALWFSDDELV